MIVNRKFKDSLFTTLFNDTNLLRELYCALEGVTLPPDTPVSINTLKNVLYMDFYNDISFEIDGKLVILIEHMSTINPNMALRLLFYISDVYEAMVDSKTLYSKKPVSIPWPEFFVLYNGQDEFPDVEILRLSKLFTKPQDLGLPKKIMPFLDLEVKVININEGRNEAITSRCKKLYEYSFFTAKAHAFWKELGNLEEGIKAAIKYCRKHDIMSELLEKNAKEILSMLYTEWNMDDALAVAREEGREEGHAEGWEKCKKQEKLTTARKLLAENSTLEFIQKITGLDLEIIQNLKN